MSPRSTKWVLWAVAMCTAPLPYMLGGPEIAPPLRLAFFTGLIAALEVSEGSGGWVWHTFLAMGAVQLLAWGFALYLVAGLIARAAARLAPRTRLITVSLLSAAAFAVAIAVPIYETPMSSDAEYSRLTQVLS